MLHSMCLLGQSFVPLRKNWKCHSENSRLLLRWSTRRFAPCRCLCWPSSSSGGRWHCLGSGYLPTPGACRQPSTTQLPHSQTSAGSLISGCTSWSERGCNIIKITPHPRWVTVQRLLERRTRAIPTCSKDANRVQLSAFFYLKKII